MKITIVSDLHLEFGTLELVNSDHADVLILGGDICVAADLNRGKYDKFFETVSNEYPHVMYVMGNHEHYGGDFVNTYQVIKEYLSDQYSNIHLLEKESVVIDSVKFIGGTMWTDMNGRDGVTLSYVGDMMSDFKGQIKNSSRQTYRRVPLYEKDDTGQYTVDQTGKKKVIGMKMKESPALFSTEDAANDHDNFLKYLSAELDESMTNVVMTHHAPSSRSVHLKYKADSIMNGGYRSNLDFFIEDHPEIILWTHGHMHDEFDYNINNNTRVICNPRGYIGHEIKAYNFVPKTIEI